MKQVQKPKKPIIFYYVIALIVILLLNLLLFPRLLEPKVTEVDYGKFLQMVDNNEISEVQIQSNEIIFSDKSSPANYYKTGVMNDYKLVDRLYEAGITEFGTPIIEQMSPLMEFLLTWVIPIVVMVALGQWLMKRMTSKMMGGMGNAMSFGKSNAKVYVQSETGIKFADVAGEDEAKEILQEIVDFLHNPKKYEEIGAKMPKGALLVGPPGTGKTLLAKAVAGEANVPFFSISGSEFVEMFVGMGAAKVRDLFQQANEKAPCIVFIDEIDTVGKKRDGGGFSGNDEREQTLNQLLAEMDGFDGKKGVVILAATNRPDSLDPALLRPGRFDRRVPVELPDLKGREEILKVHAKNKPLAEDVDLKQIAQTTAGFTGAELENLLNEAAIMAAKDRRRFVRQADIKSAFIKVGIGAEKRSKVISDKEKRITAYHETGHAILFHMLPDMEAVYTISIIPTGPGAAGYTMPQPENDDMFQTRGKMMQYITVCLGGRVAEELIFDDITTGASQDIKQATATARSMITKYGMSENLGLVAYDSDSDEVFIGRDWGHTKSYSENVAAAIDEEVRQMIEKCHDQAKQIILEHSYVLHECAKQLMEKEKLSRAEFEAIFEQEAQMTGTAPEVSGEI